MSPFDSRKAIRCAREEVEVEGSRRKVMALSRSAVRDMVVGGVVVGGRG